MYLSNIKIIDYAEKEFIFCRHTLLGITVNRSCYLVGSELLCFLVRGVCMERFKRLAVLVPSQEAKAKSAAVTN
jgi:hypothetical protein